MLGLLALFGFLCCSCKKEIETSTLTLCMWTRADEKGGGKPRTSASSPVSVAQQADLGDDRGGKPQGSNEDPNATANDPQTVTAHDPDTGKESTSEKVGSAQRSRQPGSLSHPSATTR